MASKKNRYQEKKTLFTVSQSVYSVTKFVSEFSLVGCELKRIIATLFLFSYLAAAQGTDALLTGVVLDSTGALVSDAKITAHGIVTGVSKTVTSNSAGAYTFVSLLPDDYTIMVEKAGFKKFVLNLLTLRVGDKVEQNLKIEVGAVIETIQVNADAEGVEYLTPTIGGLITEQRLDDLPVPDRNAMNFVLTQNGLVSTT